jgi:hypothetical protein
MPMWGAESDAQRDEYQRLARQLMDNDAGVRQYALDALKAMGPGPMYGLPSFIQILNKQFLFSKEKCIRALSLIKADVLDAMWAAIPAEHAAKKNEKTFRVEASAMLEKLRNELT